MRTLHQIIFILSILVATFAWHEQLHRNLPTHKNDDEARQGRSGALEALDFWSRSRAYPNNDIPHGRYYQAIQDAKRRMKKFSRSTESVNQWQFIGPNNLSGRT